MHTMLIRPTPEELAGFGKPDFVIYNAATHKSRAPREQRGSHRWTGRDL